MMGVEVRELALKLVVGGFFIYGARVSAGPELAELGTVVGAVAYGCGYWAMEWWRRYGQ